MHRIEIETIIFKRHRLVASCQFYRLVNLKLVNFIKLQHDCLLIKIRLVVTCHLQTCYNFLKQLAASLWIKSFDN